jgi:hypothetical protein
MNDLIASTRIREVAMGLFAEVGYEKDTSRPVASSKPNAGERGPMSMITREPSEDSVPASHRVIIVGVDDSAEAEAAAKWAVRSGAA